MKTFRFAFAFTSLTIAIVAAIAWPAVNASNSRAARQEQQTLTITASVKSAAGGPATELNTTIKAGQVSGVSTNRQVRHRMFAIVDRTQAQAATVACEAKDAEYGELLLKDGSWMAVVVCPKSASVAPIRVPELVKAKASADHATDEMSCWENTDLRMGVCVKLAANPQPTQTREHILLARQVGVSH
ncbi:MAG TPA: hypothetical protein VLL54_15665 [Pyrinomonadaceae bacterium]|nr:hypothetical protein [Pyrinomonadaceae bacterium]